MEAETENYMGTTDYGHNLTEVRRTALREADACATYALDAEATGDRRLADFFREVQETYRRVAGEAQKMLEDGDEGRLPSGVRPGNTPAEEDPGDVSDR